VSPSREIRSADQTPLVEDTAIDHLAGLDDKVEKDFRRHLRLDLMRMMTDLAGPDPTPIVETLAMTAAMFWHELRIRQIAWNSGSEATQRAIDRSLKRYLATLRTLAMVQRVPRLQVNIAQNQVVANS
jgi:hypothetical protein